MAKVSSKMATKTSTQIKAPKIGASSSSKPPSPLMPKKSYKKKSASKESLTDFGQANFGVTGLTGES